MLREELLALHPSDLADLLDTDEERLALVELLHFPKTPTNVIINEAIEIAHRFSSSDAGRFINGILDKLAREVRDN